MNLFASCGPRLIELAHGREPNPNDAEFEMSL